MKSTTFTLLTLLVGAAITMNSAAEHNTPEALEARIAPVGNLNVVASGGGETGVAETTTTAAAPAQDGKSVYDGSCTVCHAIGIAGAPKTGDVAAWEARMAKGMAVLVANAINGFQGEVGIMLPKGGNPALSDAEVEAAVIYMVEQLP